MAQKIDISTSTLVRIILILLGLWFLFLIRDVIVLLFIVLILVSALSPTVERWAKYVSRTGAVILIFLLILLCLAVVFSLLIPPLVDQIREFSVNLPSYADRFTQASSSGFLQSVSNIVRDNLNTLSGQLSDISSSILSKTFGVISGVVAVITVFVLTFYLLIEKEGLKKIYKGVMPSEWYETLAEPTRKISDKLGGWLRGHLMVMFLVGLLTTIGLMIIRLPYALTLGIWAGLVELVPIVGPWIGTITGVIVGLTVSPLMGLLTLIIYLIVQQIEGNVLVPKIMSRTVGLNPVAVILAIVIGGKLYGILGILIGVPIAAVISVIAEDWGTIRGIVTNHHR